ALAQRALEARDGRGEASEPALQRRGAWHALDLVQQPPHGPERDTVGRQVLDREAFDADAVVVVGAAVDAPLARVPEVLEVERVGREDDDVVPLGGLALGVLLQVALGAARRGPVAVDDVEDAHRSSSSVPSRGAWRRGSSPRAEPLRGGPSPGRVATRDRARAPSGPCRREARGTRFVVPLGTTSGGYEARTWPSGIGSPA